MSDRLLTRLATLNRTSVFLVSLVIMLLGLFLPGVLGGLLLLAVAALLALLAVKTWAVQRPGSRVIRLLLLAFLFFVAVTKLNA
jgi:hypothetical protein